MRITVDTVLFDAGGVLVHPDWARVAVLLAERGVIASFADLERAEHATWREMDTEAISQGQDNQRARVFLNGVLARCGVPAPDIDAVMPALDALRARGELWERVPDDVPGTLATLRARGFRLGVVSNANGKMPTKLARLGLAGHFETIVDSGLEGVEKPDPRLFHIALHRIGASASRCAFVGDLFHIDVVGARAAGLQPILVDRADLHGDRDVPRIATLGALLDMVVRETS